LIEENFAKFKKTAKFSGDPFENSLNNDDLVNYSKFSEEKLFLLKILHFLQKFVQVAKNDLFLSVNYQTLCGFSP
jgi:hypothetical protein